MLGAIALSLSSCFVVEVVSVAVCSKRHDKCLAACDEVDPDLDSRELCYEVCDDEYGACTIETTDDC